MIAVKRIFHTWEKWECYPGGMYETTAPDGMTPKEANQKYAAFLRDIPLFEQSMTRLLDEWPHSCEHYLSNEKMNRIAWLGQAAVCIYSRIPKGFRGGYNLLNEAEQKAADDAALRFLNLWLERHQEPAVDLVGAGIDAKADIY